MKNVLSICLFFLMLLLGIFAQSVWETVPFNQNTKHGIKNTDGRIGGYNYLGTDFAYYKIPADLSREDLITLAQKLHENEPDGNLVLVDDESKAQDYIQFAQIVNPNYNDIEIPKNWAEKHIIANVQRHRNGMVSLCKGYGNKEIAGLR